MNSCQVLMHLLYLALCTAIAYAPKVQTPPPPSELVMVYEFENVHDPDLKAYFTTPIIPDEQHKTRFRPSPKALFCLLKAQPPGQNPATTRPIGSIFIAPDQQAIQVLDPLDPGVQMLGAGWTKWSRVSGLVPVWIAKKYGSLAQRLIFSETWTPMDGCSGVKSGISALPPQYCM